MTDYDPNVNHNPDEPEQEEEEFVPASFEKRVGGWMGIAYMVILMSVGSFAMFTGGGSLYGSAPILLLPVSLACLLIAIHRRKNGTARGGMALTVLVVILCIVAFALGAIMGIPAVVSGYRAILGG